MRPVVARNATTGLDSLTLNPSEARGPSTVAAEKFAITAARASLGTLNKNFSSGGEKKLFHYRLWIRRVACQLAYCGLALS